MLWNVDDVCRRAAALMDDPAMETYDRDYQMPFINIHWDDLCNELSMLGLDYQQFVVVIPTFPADTTDFSQFMCDGQPLASLMLPEMVEWKPAGAPDTEYDELNDVDELDDVPDDTVGMTQWKWAGGNLQVTPSSVPVDVRVTFLAMSTTLVDPDDKMVRGCSNVIAYKVASLIYSIRGNDALALKMQTLGEDSLETFERAAVMRDQAKVRRVPPMHPRFMRNNIAVASTTTQ